ncbi:hypothetical protein [Clostridium sp. UBA6640]|uniref:hypothetical protein n=1 Tax=Clostridium sp. UBA6640 TaxID=1946370 RepID=UPI0025C0D8DF|nr:hypothetical protein [Clostridium sp. UBA6640]
MNEKNKYKVIFAVIACIVFGSGLFLDRPINKSSLIRRIIIYLSFIIGIITGGSMNIKRKHIIFLLSMILSITLITILSIKEIIPGCFFIPYILTIVGLSIILVLYKTIKNLILYYKSNEDE